VTFNTVAGFIAFSTIVALFLLLQASAATAPPFLDSPQLGNSVSEKALQ